MGSVYNSNLAVAAAGDARNTVGGWIGFVSFLVLLVELGVVAMRFINFAFVYQYPLMVMIAVSKHSTCMWCQYTESKDHRPAASGAMGPHSCCLAQTHLTSDLLCTLVCIDPVLLGKRFVASLCGGVCPLCRMWCSVV